MFCCRYCPCCYYVVIIPGYYFLSFLFLLLWSFLLLLASPANVVAVAALCLSLANKVDVVAHRNAVLGGVCCWVVAHPARIVTVRASIAPNPRALGGAVSKSNERLATCSYCCLNCCVLVCGRDNCQPQVAFVRATGRRIAPTGLTFPQNVAFSSVGVLRIPTRTCCITRAASALSSVPLSTRSEVVDVTARLSCAEAGST